MSTEIERLYNDIEDSFKTTFEGNLSGVLKRYIELKAAEVLGGGATVPTTISRKITDVDGNYTVLTTDSFLRANVVGITITLPPSTEFYDSETGVGKQLDIKKTVNETGNITIKADGVELIKGPSTDNNTKVISLYNDSVTLIATASGWEMI